MNPYNFVPLGPSAPRRKVCTHERFDKSLHTGTLVCRISALTDVFFAATHRRKEGHQHERLSFTRDGDKPIIPGSSLKGLVRSIVEALSGSCMLLPARFAYPKKHGGQIEYRLPPGFNNCGNAKNACPACRIFGLLGRDEVNIHAGNISLEDAQLINDGAMEWITVAAMMEPKPRHDPWYGDSSIPPQIRGRKFYLHRPDGPNRTSIQNEFNKTIEAMKAGADFRFVVNYGNLADDELSLLIFALILENPMRHKIGMGKGIGLGSVKITIDEWRTMDLATRYHQFNSDGQSLSGDALVTALQEQQKKYYSAYADWQRSLIALREIWTWDEKQTREVQYPTQMWFADFGTTPIEQVPDDAGQYMPRKSSVPPRAVTGPSPFLPDRERTKVDAAAEKKAQQLLRAIEKTKQSQATLSQTAYRNNDAEPKARVEQAEDGSWVVALPKLPEQRIVLKSKPQYSKAAAGIKIRVRVVVDKNGNILRAEEL